MSDVIRATVITIIVGGTAWLGMTVYHTLQTMTDSLVDTTYGSPALLIPDGSSTLSEDAEHIRQDYYRLSRQR